MNILLKIRTLAALGPSNLMRVGIFRLGLKTKLHPVQRLTAVSPKGPFFHDQMQPVQKSTLARTSWHKEESVYFGLPLKSSTNPPNWHTNPFNPNACATSQDPWWQIPDFDTSVGDIKTVWEASRFDWLIAMAQRAAKGDAKELDRLNIWLQDWVQGNPPYLGANWKCGQEASIRVMHLMLTAYILGQISNPHPDLIALVQLHLKRIAPTMGYAIGQANNHGTSEAAALFIGGSWLVSLGNTEAKRWQSLGRHWLEDRAKILICRDGTFSQYSVNYHRMMLDTYAFSEVWRRRLALPAFSDACLESLSAATDWLFQLTDQKSGDAPNLGANDGTRLFALTDTDYRDFRPSVQLATQLFQNRRAYAKTGLWDQPAIWLNIKTSESVGPTLENITLDSGGLHILRQGEAVVFLRYPRFRFRPSQSDALHCDLWIKGENFVRDAGTFSYNVSAEDTAYFNGTRAHNTIEFDQRDQMPRLGRFLFGDWLQAKGVVPVAATKKTTTASAAYSDRRGVIHKRHISLEPHQLTCTDIVSGFQNRAVLRWRLSPGDWKLEGQTLINGPRSVSVCCTVPIDRIKLTQGDESRYYLQKKTIPVLEIEITHPATLVTVIHF